MSNFEHTTYKSVARSSGESFFKNCRRCGAPLFATVIRGPSERRGVPCGCRLPMEVQR